MYGWHKLRLKIKKMCIKTNIIKPLGSEEKVMQTFLIDDKGIKLSDLFKAINSLIKKDYHSGLFLEKMELD